MVGTLHWRRHSTRREGLRERILAIIETVELWSDRAYQRRELRHLPDHLLHDIAVSKADVEAETAKHFWQD
jgi:uncharacterized protein YjiS (DUF1127 family)